MVIFHIKTNECSSFCILIMHPACFWPVISVTIVILFVVISFVQCALYFQLPDLLYSYVTKGSFGYRLFC